VNLIDERADVARAVREQMFASMDDQARRGELLGSSELEGALDPELERQLMELGYLGGTGVDDGDDDPED
jgi:hypothetical protein